MKEKDYWVGFSVFPGVGPVTFQKLLGVFGSAKTAWLANESDLCSCLGEKKIKDFLQFRQTFDFSDYEKRIERAQVRTINLEDPLYPEELKAVRNAPFVLYARGNIGLLNSKELVAIVGTRKITQYGRQVTEMFTRELVAAECTIISGLAMGVDAVAHQTTIASGGKTIAVLGCGVDCCYPRENQKIYDAILIHEGLILSEIPLGLSAGIGTFPARNRIVAGISDGILVTEGAEDSGALITAEFGIEYRKKVFSVPGPITSSLSKGPYKLIEKGATLVTRPEDILKELFFDPEGLRTERQIDGQGTTGIKSVKGDTKEEQIIIDLLKKEPLSFDDLVRSTKIASARLASLVSIMELKGIITSSSNSIFSLVV